MFAAPAFAQLEAIGPAALADSVTVPLILSTLAGGAVYAALQSKDAKTVLAQVVEAARTEEPPQHLADSSSPLVKGFEEPMAAVKQAFNDAIAQPPIESLAGSQTPAASPGAASTTGLSGPEPADKAASTELSVPMTQRAALTREEAIAIDQVMSADKKASNAAKQAVAATVQPAQEPSTPSIPFATSNSMKTAPAERKSSRAENIFDLAVETRRRLQAEYERKMAAIRADTAQKEAAEAKRQQQRSAQIIRLQTATESQAAKERLEAAKSEHPMGPFNRLLALLMAAWAWLQRQVSRLTNRSSSGSGAPSSA
ncbi:g7160 [Coccomyxa viridis]|uniref:G7160 protein n=1 Tax=Coccomyxa viridis TaxID=1274662 RepID=A0ABP1FX54_9CHLO